MKEMKTILREEFKAEPIMKFKNKEFWANNEKLFVINSTNGQMLKMYHDEHITEEEIEKLLS